MNLGDIITKSLYRMALGDLCIDEFHLQTAKEESEYMSMWFILELRT